MLQRILTRLCDVVFILQIDDDATGLIGNTVIDVTQLGAPPHHQRMIVIIAADQFGNFLGGLRLLIAQL